MSRHLMHTFRGIPPRVGVIAGSSLISTLAVILISGLAFSHVTPQIIPSPRATLLPNLSEDDQEELSLWNDEGLRVGRKEGRKVLLVHGISTPCLALGGIANGLVKRGCRVMLVDLVGRGYSDGVSDLPHDSRLYTSQLLVAICSSPLCWTGTGNGFNLIGYSLGGGISADFASCFPEMVLSLTLLAPSGLIRPHHFGYQSKILYSPWMPERLAQWIVRRRLQGPIHNTTHDKTDIKNAISEEIKGARDPTFESAPLSESKPWLTVGGAVQWQLDYHAGFINSFVSSIKHASISGKQETWRKLGLRPEKVLIMAGSTDSVIIPSELQEDALASIGSGKVEWRVIEGGHDFPIRKASDVVEQISSHWNL